MTGIQMTEKIFKAVDDKKAMDIIVLKMAGVSDISDYSVICSAGSDVQAKAIADHVEEMLAKEGVFTSTREGYDTANWVLLDYAHCVVHIFIEQERDYYNLEKLWAKAERIYFEEPAQ